MTCYVQSFQSSSSNVVKKIKLNIELPHNLLCGSFTGDNQN